MYIVLLHYAAPPVVGGVETVLARQAQLLQRAGHQVTVLTGRGQTWDERIPVQVLPLINSRHPLILKTKAQLDSGSVPEEYPALVDQILAELRLALLSADVVIAHNVASLHKNLALTEALYRLSQSGGGPRVILWHHDLAWRADRYEKELHAGQPWDLLRTAWPGVRQVVVSEARRQELADLTGLPLDEISVVPNGLDWGDFLGMQPRTIALIETLQLVQAAPILLTPVRITRRKNLEMALAITAALRRGMPNAALVITGPPGAHNPANQTYLEDLKSLRADLELEGAVHLLAEYLPEGLPDASVADFYRLADALLLPSLEEGFGIPILEAGLARLPIFCSDLPSLQALAGSLATYFSPEDSPVAVAGMMVERLKMDAAYKMRVRVRQEYTWDGIYQRLIMPLLEDGTQ